ncbi:translation initiation factor IF-3, mitochondrial isoform X1 [Hemiscyllium ocellatum]|uniref:translation initiation factor IF-3, mitochondrial isoform X1 n=2 Tax=Hemiscyllium ocellatum TaxID=170820 RepID=UPI0029666D60|nr:translation initiation factor IF-3, mitochondrial isoform X1 [Hemiscyllium ocellatum]XP_060682096.1 translation initiation factor IF-3, mitochondrial isoform X1 [Hemiscyllium ocellatum]
MNTSVHPTRSSTTEAAFQMAAHCIKKLALQTTTGYACWYFCNESSRYFNTLLIQTVAKEMTSQSKRNTPYWKLGHQIKPVKAFITANEGEGEPEKAQHREKKDPKARKTIGSVGRKIHHRIIHVIDENGENLGNLHRADVIRIMDERGVKAVPLRENADPPVYKLMTGKQIHDEQMKLREKRKNEPKTGPCQIKEQTFSADIAKHDLQTKIKQIQQWIDKKHHVRITVRKGAAMDKADKMEILLDQIVQSMPDKATYVFRPKVIKEGKAAMCILRHLSDKEMNAHKKDHGQQSDVPNFAATQIEGLPLGNTKEKKIQVKSDGQGDYISDVKS